MITCICVYFSLHYIILLCHIIWYYLRLDYHFMLYKNTIRFTQVPSQELTSEVRQRCISAFRTILMGSQRPGWVEFLRKFPWFCLRKSGKFRKIMWSSLELLNYLNPAFMSTCHCSWTRLANRFFDADALSTSGIHKKSQTTEEVNVASWCNLNISRRKMKSQILSWGSWKFEGTPPMPRPPRDKAALRDD